MLCLMSLPLATFSQESPKNQIAIWHDNDFLTLTDRYYSFGLGVDYTRKWKQGIFKNTREQIRFQLYQKAYTPDNLRTSSLRDMDRRYAGFLGLETGYTVATQDLFEAKLLLGIIGPNSGAGGFQRWYHKNIVQYVVPSWAEEMPDQFHTNLSLSYKTEWQLAPIPFGVSIVPTPSVTYGTKDIYAEMGGEIFFGRKSPIRKSMAYGQIGDLEREIYFSIHWNYRWVSRNVLFEQNLPGLIQEPNSHVKLTAYKFHHRFNKNEYRVGYYFVSSEAQGLGNIKYLQVSYGRSF